MCINHSELTTQITGFKDEGQRIYSWFYCPAPVASRHLFPLRGAPAAPLGFLLCLSPAETLLVPTLGLEMEQGQVIIITADNTSNRARADGETTALMKLFNLKFCSIQFGKILPG